MHDVKKSVEWSGWMGDLVEKGHSVYLCSFKFYPLCFVHGDSNTRLIMDDGNRSLLALLIRKVSTTSTT